MIDAPETVKIEVPGAAPAPQPTEPTAKPRRSFRKSGKSDGQGGRFYTTCVDVDGYKVYSATLDKDLLRAVTAADAQFNAYSTDLKARIEKGEQVDATVEARRVEELTQAREAAYYPLLQNALVGWELPDDEEGKTLPCTPETVADLPFEVVTEIATKIQTKQVFGQGDANVLKNK